MSLVATLICNPANPALDSTVVDGARAILPSAGPAHWLFDEVAVDIPFVSTEDIGAIANRLRSARGDLPIDIVVQPQIDRRKKLFLADMDSTMAMDVIIYHNTKCGTSRNTLAMIRNAGIEPHIVEYLKSPPTRALLVQLLARGNLSVRDIVREKEPLYRELKLDDPALTDEALLDAIMANPILLQRPLVVTPQGVRICRPSELVLDLLPPQRGEFFKEDGEPVIDREGRRVATA